MTNSLRSEIQAIKSIKTLRAVFSALFAHHLEIVGERQARHNDDMFTDGCEFKALGNRWWKERAISVAECIVAKESRRSRFIPPSEETLAWGGFLGGETVHWTDKDAKAAAIETIKKIIAQAR
jgi:hypothetical protein